MKKVKFIWVLMLLIGFKSQAQLQLINLADLENGQQHHQNGKIPVFKSALLQLADFDQPKVITDRLYDLYDQRNLMAVVDGQLVVFPKNMLAISNGFKPFKDLMNISNGFEQLKFGYGVAQWNELSISNGYFYFRGMASLRGLHILKGNATTMSLVDWPSTKSSAALTTDNPDESGCWGWGNCDNDERDFELNIFLHELWRTHNPWDMVDVMVDGVMVKMPAGALAGHLRNGAFTLGGGDGRMPEFP